MGEADEEKTTVMGGASAARSLPALLAERYQIREVLGEGGMGVVCRGFDLDLEETVAIKFLRAELADDEALRARFRREVKLARRVTHPNVARVFEFGRDGPFCFLTMEFIAGESLQAMLRREAPMAPERALVLALGLCEGLAAAHAAGVVHGDLKPGNVLMDPRRGAVLTDFGIAQALSERAGGDCATSGTPLYMAPEQARGEVMVPATDVFALGVVLCEALTGRTPWPKQDATALILQRRAGREPELSDLFEGISAAWSRLIAECLRGSPARRPADAQAVLARLKQMRIGAGSLPASAPEHAGAAGAAGASRWIAVAPLAAPFELAWVTADLIAALARTRGLRVVAGAGARADVWGRVEGAAHAAPGGVAVSLRLRGPDGGLRLHEVVQPSGELPALGAALARWIVTSIDPDLAPPVLGEELPADVSELYVRARQAYATLHYERACELFAAGLARAPGSRVFELGLTLARVQRLTTFRDVGEAELTELCALVEEAVLANDAEGEAHLARARLAMTLGDMPKVARSALAAVARAPSLGEAHGLLGDLLIDIGRLPDAERRLEMALELERASSVIWVSQVRLRLYQGRDEERVRSPELAPLLFGSPAYIRLQLWRNDVPELERAAVALRRGDIKLPPRMAFAAQKLVEFGLGLGDPRRVIRELRGVFVPTSSARRNALYGQMVCEMLCQIGELGEAMQTLTTATERDALCDWQWAAHCPMLGPLRGEAGFSAILERLRARADAVADAIWGSGI